MKRFYEFGYRATVISGNILAYKRKLEYLKIFMGDILEKTDSPKTFLDIGCANGYLLGYLKSLGHNVNYLYGTELTVSFVAFAKSFYGLKYISAEEPKDVSFDYIGIMHVLEHMPDADLNLIHYRKMLKDDGHLFVAVPYWHDRLFDISGSKMNFETLYHTNHINVWTLNGFRNILRKTGFKIIREEYRFYGYFVLCQKDEPQPIIKENYEDIIGSTIREKLAIEFLNKEDYESSLSQFELNPYAFIGLAEAKKNISEKNKISN